MNPYKHTMLKIVGKHILYDAFEKLKEYLTLSTSYKLNKEHFSFLALKDIKEKQQFCHFLW